MVLAPVINKSIRDGYSETTQCRQPRIFAHLRLTNPWCYLRDSVKRLPLSDIVVAVPSVYAVLVAVPCLHFQAPLVANGAFVYTTPFPHMVDVSNLFTEHGFGS